MIFSRDAVEARIASRTDRYAILQFITALNILLGCALLLVSCFVSSTWGAGLSFQATSTALVHLGVSVAFMRRLQHPDTQRSLDLMAGAFLVMMVMLLQTYVAWAGLSQGFFSTSSAADGSGAAAAPCIVQGRSWTDKPTSVLAGVLLLTNLGLAALIAVWRDDFRAGGEYTAIHHPHPQSQSPSSPSNLFMAASAALNA